MFHRVGVLIGVGMTILQPFGNDKHPSSCMDRLVGNTDSFPALRLLDFTPPPPYFSQGLDFTRLGLLSNTSIEHSHERLIAANRVARWLCYLCVSFVHIAAEILIQSKHSFSAHRTAALEAFPRICPCLYVASVLPRYNLHLLEASDSTSRDR